MTHKYIQIHGPKDIFESKVSGIEYITELVNSGGTEEYKDGELLTFRYRDIDDKVYSIYVTLSYDETDGVFNVLQSDGTHVVESDTEPEDKDALWICDSEDEGEKIQDDIRSLRRALNALITVVNRHEHAFSHTLNSGDIYNNATDDMMSGAYPEEITLDKFVESDDEDVEDVEDEDTVNATDFDLYIGNTPLTAFTSTNTKSHLYKGQRYWLRPKFTPSGCSLLDNHIVYASDNEGVTVYENGYMLGSYSGDATIIATMTNEITSVTKEYSVSFKFNEEPDYCDYSEPNIKHLIIKSVATIKELDDNLNYLCVNELIWCEEDNGLYIKARLNNGNIRKIKINGGISYPGQGEGGNDGGDEEEIIDIMEGIIQDVANKGISSINFISTNGNKFSVKVDDYGDLKTEIIGNVHSASAPSPSGTTVGYIYLQKSLAEGGLFINSVYCGGINLEGDTKEVYNEHSFNRCSHNFVELSNTTKNDIYLDGLSLQYATMDSTSWKVLPLHGVIKSQSTFLIRGSQCAKMDTNTTVIKVTDYDMEWNDDSSYADDKKIQFSNIGSKFYLTYGIKPYEGKNPYKMIQPADKSQSAYAELPYGYIDLVGVDNGTYSDGGYEGESLSKGVFRITNDTLKNYLITRYYNLDPAKQAYKEAAARSNASQMYMVDLTKEDGEIIRDIKCYTPVSSKMGKNFFFNKSLLDNEKPTIVTCSLGIQGTCVGEVSGAIYSIVDKDNHSTETTNGATRCFNWVSKDYYDECLWLRQSGYSDNDDEFEYQYYFESIDGLTGVRKYYNRQRQEYPDGAVLTAHKQILYNIPVGTYEYIVGRCDSKHNPIMEHCSDVYTFEVKDVTSASTFSFVQTSDQQGFNWDEYSVWGKSADYIVKNEEFDFMINTGDMTQSGNRINEWIDYFNFKGGLKNYAEMATIGNNDLSPANLTELGFGADSSKINHHNITFFYTFEMDEKNPPIFSVNVNGTTYEDIYVPSLYSFNYGNAHFMCVNSEITDQTESIVYGMKGVDNTDCGYLYNAIETWCKKDVDNTDNSWKIVFCHEMPFTIITADVMDKHYKQSTDTLSTNADRAGSHLNTVARPNKKYWFSKFCQDNDIRLVIGGHKHTQATSWPIKETEKSMIPTIQVTTDDLEKYFGCSSLTKIEKGDRLVGNSYPTSWFGDTNGDVTYEKLSSEANLNKPSYSAYFCNFELVEEVTAPVYAMSQATGYKHTSNKELPNEYIPWLKYFFPATIERYGDKPVATVNTGQTYPFYTTWVISNGQIEGTVKKLTNIFDSKKFEVNSYYKKDDKTVGSVNGLSRPNTSLSADEKIIIKK